MSTDNTEKRYYYISDGDGQHSCYVEGPADSCLEDAMQAWEEDMNPRGYEMIGHPWLNREGCREVTKEEYEESIAADPWAWVREMTEALEASSREPAVDPWRLIYENWTEEEKEAHRAYWASKLKEMDVYRWFFNTHPILSLYPTPGFFLFSLGWTAIIGGMIWMYVGILIRYGM